MGKTLDNAAMAQRTAQRSRMSTGVTSTPVLVRSISAGVVLKKTGSSKRFLSVRSLLHEFYFLCCWCRNLLNSKPE